MNDFVAIPNPRAFDLDGADPESLRMVERQALCRAISAGTVGPTSPTNERNETLAKLDRLRRGYRDTGKLMEAKAIERGIEVLREGWK